MTGRAEYITYLVDAIGCRDAIAFVFIARPDPRGGIDEIGRVRPFGAIGPGAIGPPAWNGLADPCAHPRNQTRMIAHPGGDAVAVIEVEMEFGSIRDILYRLRHGRAPVIERRISRRTAGTHDDVGTGCSGQFLD